MNAKQLIAHLIKWDCIRRVVAETGKPVWVVLTEFNRLVKA
jgi:hypothetical protein